MRLELAKYFHDVQSATRTLSGFVNGKSWADYERDASNRAISGGEVWLQSVLIP